MWQQHHHPSLPVPSGTPSPQKSPRLGTFASRNEDRSSDAGLDEIVSRLKKISINVVETRDEFVSLSDRSKDNGAALESLMAEIKSFVAISNTHHTNQVRELARLNQLEQLDKLTHLDKLGNHVRDLELQQRELNARMDLWKKFDDDGLFDQIKQLNTVPAKLKTLDKLENLDQLKLLADLKGAVESFRGAQLHEQMTAVSRAVEVNHAKLDKLAAANSNEQLDRVEAALSSLPSQSTVLASLPAQLGRMEAAVGSLPSTSHMESVLADLLAATKEPSVVPSDLTSRLDKIEAVLAALPSAGQMDKLEAAIASQKTPDAAGQVHGEVRAIQDHLLGEHDEAQKELAALRQKVQDQETELSSLRSLHGSHEALAAAVAQLQTEEKQLIAHNSQLKAELKASVESLTATETKYRELENHVREVMLSKYQAALTPAVRESEIVIPKRRTNRSVSLQTT